MPPRSQNPGAAIAALVATSLACAAALTLSARPIIARERLDAEAARFLAAYRRPADVPHPGWNPASPAREALGRALFFDARLSGAGDVSCASCHDPARGWGDGRPAAVGTRGQQLERRTPTVLNTAWAAALFWDGRAETLEEQALGPIQAAGEMNLPLPELERRLARIDGYRAMFRDAFGDDSITATRVGHALATFQRGVVSGIAPFDRWVAGDEGAVSPAAKRGFVTFNTKAACATCHSGWRFTDDSFHDIGVVGADSGRAALLPGIPVARHAFKTPTLRNAVERAPYMHNGSERTLADVVDLYDRGGRVHRDSRSPLIRPLGLDARERADLVAFLETLSSRDPVVAAPRLPH